MFFVFVIFLGTLIITNAYAGVFDDALQKLNNVPDNYARYGFIRCCYDKEAQDFFCLKDKNDTIINPVRHDRLLAHEVCYSYSGNRVLLRFDEAAVGEMSPGIFVVLDVTTCMMYALWHYAHFVTMPRKDRWYRFVGDDVILYYNGEDCLRCWAATVSTTSFSVNSSSDSDVDQYDRYQKFRTLPAMRLIFEGWRHYTSNVNCSCIIKPDGWQIGINNVSDQIERSSPRLTRGMPFIISSYINYIKKYKIFANSTISDEGIRNDVRKKYFLWIPRDYKIDDCLSSITFPLAMKNGICGAKVGHDHKMTLYDNSESGLFLKKVEEIDLNKQGVITELLYESAAHALTDRCIALVYSPCDTCKNSGLCSEVVFFNTDTKKVEALAPFVGGKAQTLTQSLINRMLFVETTPCLGGSVPASLCKECNDHCAEGLNILVHELSKFFPVSQNQFCHNLVLKNAYKQWFLSVARCLFLYEGLCIPSLGDSGIHDIYAQAFMAASHKKLSDDQTRSFLLSIITIVQNNLLRLNHPISGFSRSCYKKPGKKSYDSASAWQETFNRVWDHQQTALVSFAQTYIPMFSYADFSRLALLIALQHLAVRKNILNK